MLFSEESFQIEYLKSLEKKLDQLHSMISKESYEEIITIGHHMAGSGGSFGFPKISDLGVAIENAGEANDLNTVKRLVAQFQQEITNLQQKKA